MGRYGDLYQEGRERLLSVVAGLDEDSAATTVPTCPAWSVKDVLSHVAGISADIIEGRLDGVATDPWTQAQVDARRAKTVDEIAEEWRVTGPQIDAIVDTFGPSGAQLLFDLTTHEHDVRAALGRPGARDADVITVAIDFTLTNMLDARLKERGLGPLEVRSGGRAWTVGGGDGDGSPSATLTAEPFELMRALSGRRSPGQIAALDWSVDDPSPYVSAFEGGPFTFPPGDVVE